MDAVAPAPPTGLTVTDTGDRFVALSWPPSPEYDVDLYRLLRDGTKIVEQTGTTYTDTGRTNDRVYTYTLQARDTSGNWSAVSSPGVTGMPHETVPPAPPTGLVATRGDGRVTLSWAANTESDFTDYVVLRNGVDIATVTTRSYVDTGVTNDVTYSYTLVARDTYANRSAPSSPAVSATPTDLTPPVRTHSGWWPPGGTSRSCCPGRRTRRPTWPATGCCATASQVATVTGTTLDRHRADQRHHLRLHGSPRWTPTATPRPASTPPVQATPTDLTPPATPTGLLAERGDGQVTLSWAANTEPTWPATGCCATAWTSACWVPAAGPGRHRR